MAQTSYADITAAFAGQLADNGNRDVESAAAYEDIAVGYGLIKRVGYDNEVRLPKINKTVLTLSADLVASDSVVCTINDETTTPTVYDGSSHATTLTAIAVKVAALTGVASAVASARIITVLADDGVTFSTTDITVTSGGAGTAVGSEVDSTTDDTLYGVAIASNYLEQDSDGVVQYDATDTVNVLRSGRINVYVEEAVTSDDTPYLRFLANGATKLPGMFRASADSTKAFACSNCRFVTSAGAGEIAVLELGLMGV